MIGLALILALSASDGVSTACHAPPKVSVEVTLEAKPVRIASTMSAADIAALAATNHAAPAHPAYGFYVGTFGYAVTIIGSRAETSPCPHHVAVQVKMIVSGRRIEIAREVTANRCLYLAYSGHYRQHAEEDTAVIRRYHDLVQRALAVDDLWVSDEAQTRLKIIGLVESALQSMNKHRKEASFLVDSPAEVERLQAACTSRL